MIPRDESLCVNMSCGDHPSLSFPEIGPTLYLKLQVVVGDNESYWDSFFMFNY